LFFTEGVSLQTWQNVGVLEREVALYRGLITTGVSVGFVTYGNKRDLAYNKQFPFINIYCNKWGIPHDWYKQKLQRFPPKADIVKSNQVSGSLTALRAARQNGAKFIARCGYLLSLNEERHGGRESQKAVNARQLEKTVFMQADSIELSTSSAARTVIQEYGISKEKIHIVPNYVETNRFRPFAVGRLDKTRIIVVGRLEPEKNLSNLIKAISPLDVQLQIVGSGSLRLDLEKLSFGSRANIDFLGNVSNIELPRLLNESDLFILPSLYEGHPKALLEAMACGLPVIGSRVPGIQEIIRDGENGILCDTDPDSIREAIGKLLVNDRLRQQLGGTARRFVEENFSLEKFLEMELSLIEELMAGTSAKS
jgi:glycosyltransferase involved in cell wall biosynthesis